MKRLALPLLLAAASCRPARQETILPAEPRPIPGHAAAVASLPPLEIKDVFPREAESGVSFDLDFDGTSAMFVSGEGFTPTSSISWDGRPLATELQMQRGLVGRIPPDLLAQPRRVAVIVQDAGPPARRSAPAEFVILPKRPAGACPRPDSLSPDSARKGIAFGEQPDGSSVFRVLGGNFGPKTTVEFGGVALKTGYRGPGALMAFVPPPLLDRPRSVPVTLSDPDCRGATRAALKFEVRP